MATSRREQFAEETGMSPATAGNYKEVEEVNFALTISAEAIEYGECADPVHCVIANALNQRFGIRGRVFPMIDAVTTRWDANGKRYVMRTPHKAAELLRQFDDPATRHLVKPCRIWFHGRAWVMSEARRQAKSRGVTARKREAKAGLPPRVNLPGPKLKYPTAIRYDGIAVPGTK